MDIVQKAMSKASGANVHKIAGMCQTLLYFRKLQKQKPTDATIAECERRERELRRFVATLGVSK